LALAALMVPARPAASPPAGIAYDETVRSLIDVPPPGLDETAPPETPAPRRRGLAAFLPGGRADGDGAAVAVAGAFGQGIHALLAGRTLHHAVYDGWERVDDPVTRTAVLFECDRDRIVHLDLERRTYRIVPPQDEPQAPVPPLRPGNATAQGVFNVSRLAPATIGGLPVTGYLEEVRFQLDAASGSCRPGPSAVESATYYSKLARPARSCPVRRGDDPVPPGAVALIAATGCRPALDVSRSGPVEPAGLFAVRRTVVFRPAPGGGAPASLGWLVERQNVTPLGPADAGLFEIPAGFTEVR